MGSGRESSSPHNWERHRRIKDKIVRPGPPRPNAACTLSHGLSIAYRDLLLGQCKSGFALKLGGWPSYRVSIHGGVKPAVAGQIKGRARRSKPNCPEGRGKRAARVRGTGAVL